MEKRGSYMAEMVKISEKDMLEAVKNGEFGESIIASSRKSRCTAQPKLVLPVAENEKVDRGF